VGLAPFKEYAATVPHQAFMIYQMMFAVITPALITGAFRNGPVLHLTRLHPPVGPSRVPTRSPLGLGDRRVDPEPGRPRLRGGTVVHITSGVSALAAALVVGKRKDSGRTTCPPTTFR